MIGNPIRRNKNRIIWIDGGNHAREWPAFHTATFFINKLLTGYGNDPEITRYINNLNFYILPILNPDGFAFSRTSKSDLIRQWRKNRAPENCTGSLLFRKNLCCEGVDLNRNYDFDFHQTFYPFNNSCSDEYQGPFPFSEPESRAVRDFITSNELRNKTDAVISLHTHGQLIILPYNHRRKTYPADYADLMAVAQKAKNAIRKLNGNEYDIGTAADIFGPATGSATDWIKRNTNIKYVYVFELPPAHTSWFAFQVKPYKLLPIAIETWNGVRVIIDQVLKDNNL
uniref:Peptidase_M14 domain-containing protein n=3 Tax=Wuchereria bancrofti TaxID=6293 RepID=A0A1I8EGY1_WUCBA